MIENMNTRHFNPGFPMRIKVVELILPGTAAAGSLFGWSLGRGEKMRRQMTDDRRQKRKEGWHLKGLGSTLGPRP